MPVQFKGAYSDSFPVTVKRSYNREVVQQKWQKKNIIISPVIW